jgi:hypothetical protein
LGSSHGHSLLGQAPLVLVSPGRHAVTASDATLAQPSLVPRASTTREVRRGARGTGPPDFDQRPPPPSLLAMLTNSLIPFAYERGKDWAGAATVLGFCLSVA